MREKNWPKRLPHYPNAVNASHLNHWPDRLQSYFSSNLLQDDAAWAELALQLFAFQYQENLAYRLFANRLERTPESISDWREIPAVPTTAFKVPSHPMSCISPTPPDFFETSGTTAEIRGRHYFPEIQTYSRSVIAAWQELHLPHLNEFPLYFLSQSPADLPHSSLVQMFAFLSANSPENPAPFLISANGLFETQTLHHLSQGEHPVGLLGTALAFLNLMERHENGFPLPHGSFLLETGGYKGSGRQLDKADFYAQLSAYFRVASDSIWNEYSMTELSSQTYSYGLGRPHLCPSTLRIQVINPETRRPVQPGELGLLVLHDLANWHSVAAIETQDLAIYHDPQQFTLIGRDPLALPRGCSRAVDAFFQS